ncbi:MAG: hypothetical protein K0B09_07555 [Bacteroidales bacterium]|nr:hypothetical protein [Bacteroidales bacterium]
MTHRKKIIFTLFALLLCPIIIFAEPWGTRLNPRENVFVNTDRDIYIAGEDLFLSVSLFTEPFTPGKVSGFAYVALRSEHEIIKRVTLKIEEGKASANIYLPDTLSSGYYELIAFTNWMRNAGEEWYFRKSIFIANRFDTSLEALLPPMEESPRVRFFPEGGKLVNGIKNKVLIVSDGPFDASWREGIIKSNSGDTLAEARLNAHGWGLFELKPEAGKSYYAEIDGAQGKFDVPPASNEGLTIFVSSNDELLRIEINPDLENVTSGNLVARKNGQIIKEVPFQLVPGEAIVESMKLNELPQGLISLEIIEGRNHVSASRYWYNFTSYPAIDILMNETFSRRERIKMELSLSGQPQIGGLNLSVVQSEAISPVSISLRSWQTALNLAEALKMNPALGISVFGGLNQKEINQRLLGISGENDFNFDEGPERNAFFMETTHLIVSGKVTKSATTEPVKDVRIILNTPDTIVNLLYTRTNAAGEFQFLLDGYYNNRELVFTPDPQTYSGSVNIEVFDKFVFEKPFQKTFFPGLAQKRDFIKKTQEVVGVNKAFEISYTGPGLTPPRLYYHAPRLYAAPVRTLRTADYAPLDDLQEIARELILAWRIRQSGSRFNHVLIGAHDRKQLSGTPALFVDGIITYDLRPLLGLNSKTINEIQVQNLEWMHGEMSFPGIIAVFTKNKTWQDLKLSPWPKVVFHEAPRTTGRFISPNYESETSKDKTPDLRPMLFWNPDLHTNRAGKASLEFFSGDLSGDYIIRVEGIDQNKKAFDIQKTITINH